MRNDALLELPEELINGFAQCLDRESLSALANFQLPTHAQARLDALAERANLGALTPDERSEYEAFINASEFFAQAQLRARVKLGLPPAA